MCLTNNMFNKQVLLKAVRNISSSKAQRLFLKTYFISFRIRLTRTWTGTGARIVFRCSCWSLDLCFRFSFRMCFCFWSGFPAKLWYIIRRVVSCCVAWSTFSHSLHWWCLHRFHSSWRLCFHRKFQSLHGQRSSICWSPSLRRHVDASKHTDLVSTMAKIFWAKWNGFRIISRIHCSNKLIINITKPSISLYR